LTKRMSQRGFAIGVGAAIVFLVVATYLAWKLILDKRVNLPHLTNSIDMEFVRIPAGKFLMGSPRNEEGRGDDEDEHEVEITHPYYLGIHEVTQQQFKIIVGDRPQVFTSAIRKPTHPVVDVAYDDAVEFCRKLSELPAEKHAGRHYRLPTEAEWEYACRAGARREPFSFGAELPLTQATISNKKWEEDVKRGVRKDNPMTTAAGIHPANAWGLFDMHGNVMEWCSDWYEAGYYSQGPVKDPPGPATGTQRVARGGYFGSYPEECRSAQRYGLSPSIRLGMGFRVVLVVEKE
jgi:formylglycine-generating enzyme required for sulfatase activity